MELFLMKLLNAYFLIGGEKFRTEYSHLNEIRSLISETVKVMALTATATKITRNFIIKA